MSTPRPFQQEFQSVLQARLAMLAQHTANQTTPSLEEKTIIANIYPGSGKSLMALLGANTVWQNGQIDAVVVFVPRLNLAAQIELSWTRYRHDHPGERLMERVCRVENVVPLLRHKNQFGYVTTYASVVADPAIHQQFFKQHQGRVLLILDESHILGYDTANNSGTQAARDVLTLAQDAALVVLMTGTPYRGDGEKLILARYSDVDEKGLAYLQPDVNASYLDGVRGDYLRPFEAELFNASIQLEVAASGASQATNIADMEKGLGLILRDMRFAEQLVDRFVEKVEELRGIWSHYCGLIAAADQKHAKAIADYLKRRYPRLKYLVAVSDDQEAQRHLAEFRKGGYHVLITVAMAHIGFDHPPISTICCLSTIRDEGWLRQLFARAMRVILTGDPAVDEAQCAFVITPDDPAMQRIVDALRTESEQGVSEKKQASGDSLPGTTQTESVSMIVTDVQNIEGRALGLEAENDVPTEEFLRLDAIRKKHKIIAVPLTALNALVREASQSGSVAPNTNHNPPTADHLNRTARETEDDLRSEIKRIQILADGLLGAPVLVDWGVTYAALKRHFKREMEGDAHCREALRWLETVWLPKCRRIAQQRKTSNHAQPNRRTP
jgi:superfamily II DNA or RNA helicase